MKKLSSKAHGILDYVTVILLLASPFIFQMGEPLATFTFSLAGVHLLLTVFTDFELGVFRKVPFSIHGMVEITVAFALIGVAYWFKSAGDRVGFIFYLVMSAVILGVWFLSDYKSAGARAARN